MYFKCLNCEVIFQDKFGCTTRKYCCLDCKFEHIRKPKVIIARFLKHVEICEHGWDCKECCFQWCDVTTHYGTFVYRKGTRVVSKQAHRFMWWLKFGKVPKDMEVCHNCPEGDNSLCVNPRHLWLGTQADNIKDKIKKNRQNRGETNWNARLTEEKVIKIRRMFATGNYTKREIGKLFDTTDDNVYMIVSRRTWKHI